MSDNYILIEDATGTRPKVFNDAEMQELFSGKQINMMLQGKVVILNKHHGNDWIRGMNGTACNMLVIAVEYTQPFSER